MNRISAVQVFSLLAIIVGAAVSYYPPPSNAAAIWALVSGFLGYAARDLLQGASQVPPAIAAPQGAQGGFANMGMLLVLGAIAASVTMMTGCATSAPRQTPQQLAAQVCPAVQITVASLFALRGLSAQAHEDLFVAMPVVDAVCAAGAVVDLDSLKSLSDTALPALLKIADVAPLDPVVHDQVVLGLTFGQIVLAGALQAAKPVAP